MMKTVPATPRLDLNERAAMRAAGPVPAPLGSGRIETSIPWWLLDELLIFDAEHEDLEDDAPAEDEEGG
jgi:hypothetical protein